MYTVFIIHLADFFLICPSPSFAKNYILIYTVSMGAAVCACTRECVCARALHTFAGDSW